jgi:hypothetical protein
MKAPNANGRPSQFKPEFSEQAYRLCLLGLTDAELASFFEVSERTINRWKVEYADFAGAVQSGKVVADGNVARSLYQRATGCPHPDTRVNVVDGEVVLTDVTKHYPPETQACIFWLTNRQPENWKNKVEIKEEINVNVFPPKEVLDALTARALEQARVWAEQLAGRRGRMGIDFEKRETD